MPGHRVRLFTLCGIKVRLHFSWVILAAIVTWSLASGYFPISAPNLAPATHWWMAAVGTVGLAGSVVAHELAHALVARHYRMPVGGITLFVFGGVAELEAEPESAKAELWMALAGPVMSVGIAILLLALTYVLDSFALPFWFSVEQILAYLSLVNAILAAFNLVPAFPMDGGRILRAGLWAWRGDQLWATRVATGAGVGLAYLIMGFGLYELVVGEILAGFWWCCIGYFIRGAALRSYKTQLECALLGLHTVEHFMRKDAVTASPEMPISSLVDDIFFGHLRKSVAVAERGQLTGSISVDDLKGTPRGAWHFRRVGSLMTAMPKDAAVPIGTLASNALQQLRRSGLQRLYVHADGHLKGEIVLRDLLDYLILRADLGEPGTARFVPAPRRVAIGRDAG